MNKKFMMMALALVTAVVLAACGNGNELPATSDDPMGDNDVTETETPEIENDENEDVDGNLEDEEENDEEETDANNAEDSNTEDVPEGLQVADNPKYAVGSEAEITTDHMEGMKGATATIEGAYETTAYVVSYIPALGGDVVENHKWIIHEEIEDAQDEPYEAGDEVIIDADHTEGTKGAEAEIESAEETVVYMVTYTDTENDEEVKNHKWVTEDELAEIE